MDIKTLGKVGRVGHRIHGDRRTRVRGIGWEAVHVAIDDHTRWAYLEVLPEEQAVTTTGFLARAVAHARPRPHLSHHNHHRPHHGIGGATPAARLAAAR